MKATCDKLAVVDEGIAVGIRIEYFPGGPVRFVQGMIPWGLFNDHVLDEMMRAQIRLTDRWLDSEPADEPLPGLE